jgi:hypothetical protein
MPSRPPPAASRAAGGAKKKLLCLRFPGLMKVKKIMGQCPGGTHEHSPVIDGWGREM